MDHINLTELLDRIYCADKEEINPIINAITERYAEVWPEWELLIISVQGHRPEDHIKALQNSISLLSQMQ